MKYKSPSALGFVFTVFAFFVPPIDCDGQACSGHWVANRPLTFQCISGQQIGLPPLPDPVGCPINPVYTALQTNTFIFDTPVNDFFIDFNAFSSATGCARLQVKINGIFFHISPGQLVELPFGSLCSGSVSFLTVTNDGFITTSSLALPNSNGQGRLVFSGVNASSITISTNDSGGGSVVASPCMALIPLQILYFNGTTLSDCITKLNFESGIETNVRNIEVEESYDGISFFTVLELLPLGNDSRYSVSFRNSGSDLFRLKINDFDGRFSFSEIIRVERRCNRASIQIFPNPSTQKIIVENVKGNDHLFLFDMWGRLNKTIKITHADNEIDIGNLISGVYVIKVFRKNELIATEKFIKR